MHFSCFFERFYLLTHRIISFVQLVLIIYSLIALTYQLIQRNWPFFDRFFDPPTFLIFSSIAHAFLIIQSIELIGESKKTDDCSGKVIVESVETQRNEMGRMKMALVEEIVKEDQDFKIHLKITDPSGAPKSLADTDLNTEVSRKFEMNSDYRFIDFSREINTKTSVETSKHQKTTPEDSDDGFLAPNSKFNGCRKQPKPLSPRRIL
ncbi:Protein CBG15843 [Caenorhabditis briggsae]|uniref:Protein CBG15843 n=1 Tax=Caenorhabditis briggsae TaxID=6238 RepID=A8XMW7_CAEBR|nr:Protein CBG15843 [Caenorhabditis briggsae]CAP33992.2 Protein CBG15843 [Caenorhabditis briggsae]